MRSLSRVTVAVAFVLALVLSTVPAQAQPRDLDFGLLSSDVSWLDAALGWLEGLFGGGGEAESLEIMTTGGRGGSTDGPGGNVGTMSGSCLDPFGNPCVDDNG